LQQPSYPALYPLYPSVFFSHCPLEFYINKSLATASSNLRYIASSSNA
jgi:hypothetical protein